MIAGRADRHQILSLLFGRVQRADGGELAGDLIAAQRVNTAAALPILQLLKFKTQSLGAGSGICIPILRLIAQCSAGKIAVDHNETFLNIEFLITSSRCICTVPKPVYGISTNQ